MIIKLMMTCAYADCSYNTSYVNDMKYADTCYTVVAVSVVFSVFFSVFSSVASSDVTISKLLC